MVQLTPLQLAGVCLLVIGAIWWLTPTVAAWIAARRSRTLPAALDGPEALAERMGRLAALQSDLEARGHMEEANLAGEWYCLLRDPIEQQEAPLP